MSERYIDDFDEIKSYSYTEKHDLLTRVHKECYKRHRMRIILTTLPIILFVSLPVGIVKSQFNNLVVDVVVFMAAIFVGSILFRKVEKPLIHETLKALLEERNL
jgi:ABC-type transporter Mla maintaining outer membrane lipid asymmetry permease subunit MlaE